MENQAGLMHSGTWIGRGRAAWLERGSPDRSCETNENSGLVAQDGGAPAQGAQDEIR
jgi:hypothetical protein